MEDIFCVLFIFKLVIFFANFKITLWVIASRALVRGCFTTMNMSTVSANPNYFFKALPYNKGTCRGIP